MRYATANGDDSGDGFTLRISSLPHVYTPVTRVLSLILSFFDDFDCDQPSSLSDERVLHYDLTSES